MPCVRELDDEEQLDLNRMLNVDPMLQLERKQRLILLEKQNNVERKFFDGNNERGIWMNC